MTTTDTLTIAEAAAHTGVTAHTLRYYERIGLLDAVERDATGRRRFGEQDLARVDFLQRMRRTGMPIRQMTDYVELVRAGPHTEAARLQILETHRERVRADLRELNECLDVIDFKIDLYRRSTS